MIVAMKIFTSFLTITAQLMSLACFVGMSGSCVVEAKAYERPCHAKQETSQKIEHKHHGGCDQCKISHKNWSTPATLQTVAREKLLPVWEKSVLFTKFDLKYPEPVFEMSPTRTPPENLFWQTYPRIFRSTRWNTSGR